MMRLEDYAVRDDPEIKIISRNNTGRRIDETLFLNTERKLADEEYTNEKIRKSSHTRLL
jgi:hypothetical protein